MIFGFDHNPSLRNAPAGPISSGCRPLRIAGDLAAHDERLRLRGGQSAIGHRAFTALRSLPVAPPLALNHVSLSRQARLRRRHAPHAAQASPPAPITHVDGSGTGATIRKPISSLSADGQIALLSEDDTE